MFIDHNLKMKWLYQKLASLALQANNERFSLDLLGFHQELQLTKYMKEIFLIGIWISVPKKVLNEN